MGIDTYSTQFIKNYIKGNVLTIGRQVLFGENSDYANILGVSISEFEKIRAKSDGLAEGLLEHLGASQIHSIDYSDYEKATITHDLNTRIFNNYCISM